MQFLSLLHYRINFWGIGFFFLPITPRWLLGTLAWEQWKLKALSVSNLIFNSWWARQEWSSNFTTLFVESICIDHLEWDSALACFLVKEAKRKFLQTRMKTWKRTRWLTESQRKVATSALGLSGDCRQTSLERKWSIPPLCLQYSNRLFDVSNSQGVYNS